jgi:hypothetical protein
MPMSLVLYNGHWPVGATRWGAQSKYRGCNSGTQRVAPTGAFHWVIETKEGMVAIKIHGL